MRLLSLTRTGSSRTRAKSKRTKVMSDDYQQKYFNERFGNIESKLDKMNSNLTGVLEDHERRIRASERTLQENKEINELRTEMDRVKLSQEKCDIHEVKENQKQLEADFQSLRFFVKNPRMVTRLFTGAIVLSMISVILSLSSVMGLIDKFFGIS